MSKILLVFFVFTALLMGCKPKKAQSKYEFLKAAASDVNKKCPVKVENDLRLDSTVALPEATLRYNFTLTFDTVVYDIREFEKSLRTDALSKVKTSPDAKMFRDINATLEYDYNDTLGNHLFRIIISPEDYRQGRYESK